MLTQEGAQLPQLQSEYGQVSQQLGEATGRALQAKQQLAQKTAEYQGGLEQQAADKYQQAASGVHFQQAPSFVPPKETLSGLAGLFGMVMTLAFAGGRGSKSSGMAALAGMTGALKGYREGNQQLFQNSLQTYNENLKKVQEDNQTNLDLLNQIKQAYAVDQNKIPALVAEFQAKNGNSYLSALVAQGKLQVASDYMGKLMQGAQQALSKSAELTNQLQIAQGRNQATLEAARLRAGASLEAARLKLQAQQGQEGSVESTASMIANYQYPPLSGWALRTPWGEAVMARIRQINPNYDATRYGEKSQAVKSFATGPQGNLVRSFNVAIFHLDTLQKLSDALANGDTKAFNALAQQIAAQTGDPAPTDFNAARQIVGQEIVKAIVAGGGGVTERQEAAKQLSNANSPSQLANVIKTYKELMGGQLRGLSKQYEQSTGLKNFNEFLYPETQRELEGAQGKPAQSGLPPGWSVQVQ